MVFLMSRFIKPLQKNQFCERTVKDTTLNMNIVGHVTAHQRCFHLNQNTTNDLGARAQKYQPKVLVILKTN